MSHPTLSATYFGPISWYRQLCSLGGDCSIDGDERFVKQTVRSRCQIATAGGRQTLSVPVEHPEGQQLGHTPMRDVRVSTHAKWQHQHWQALQSAYGESPFFEFYADDLRPIFERQWTFLLDLDLATTSLMTALLDIPQGTPLQGTPPESTPPRRPAADRPYHQVFLQKFGFMPNLSILDLLFNEGPEAVLYL